VSSWVCCGLAPTQILPEYDQPQKCRVEGNAIDVENNSKLETTNTEFEATEEVKEGDDWKGGGELASDDGSEDGAGNSGCGQQACGDKKAPGGVDVVFHH